MSTNFASSNVVLKQLLDQIMHESDPIKFDQLGSEIWSVLAEREQIAPQNPKCFPVSFNELDIAMTSLNIMESTLLGMKQLRPYLGNRFSREMLDSLIQEAESQIAEIKQSVIN